MCEASPPSAPRGPCGTLAEAERVVAAARIAALRARLGTDDEGGGGGGAGENGAPSPLPSTAPPLLTRVHPSVRLFVGGVTSARCLGTLRANGVTHVVNATTCLPHFHEGRAVAEGGGAEGKKKAKDAKTATSTSTSTSCSTSTSSSPSSSSSFFSYLRVPIFDDASQDLGPHLESALAFIDAGLSFSSRGSRQRQRQRRRHQGEEECDDDDDGDNDNGETDLDLDLDFDFDAASPSPSSPSVGGGGGGGVLIHCVGGVSRSAALAAAWLVSRAGATAEGAVAAVKRARPLAAPNSGFLEQLCALEARVAAVAASSRHHSRTGCSGGGGRESDREFSRRLAALLLTRRPSGSVVVTAAPAVASSTCSPCSTLDASARPINVPPFGKRRSSSTLALSLLPSPVAEEEAVATDSDDNASVVVAVAAAAAAAVPSPRPQEASNGKKMPRATSALLHRRKA